MDLDKFYSIVEINERSRAITARHNHFEDIGRILLNNSQNITKAMEEIASYIGCRDANFKNIFLDYYKGMIQQESEDFSATMDLIKKEIEEA